MLFNSLPFAAFFIIFFFLYWFVFNRKLKLQNLFLLIGSYVFYSWWDWRFLFLIIGNSLLNYLLGIYMDRIKNQKTKDLLMSIGTVAGIGSLIYYKYANFFIVSFVEAFSKFHIHLNIHTVNLVLPLGISFYTFRTLSYLFDINNGKMKPTSDWVAFFSFVAFFPCLLSGPIDRAKSLIPQLEKKREFTYDGAVDALRQILWGFFKKMVIADNLAPIANDIFEHYHRLPASTLVLGVFYSAIQLYTDFSGYSDMAIGIGRLLGFRVAKNFDYPFFAQSIPEFWRKWHISLTQWISDYVYTPLSLKFRDYGKLGVTMAIMINFTLIGMWHGASWRFVIFGMLNGVYLVPLILRGTINKNKKLDPNKPWPSFAEFRNMLQTFVLINISIILFKAESVSQAVEFFGRIFSKSIIHYPKNAQPFFILVITLFLIIEWGQRNKQHVLEGLNLQMSKPVRWALYSFLIMSIMVFTGHEEPFIYFKF